MRGGWELQIEVVDEEAGMTKLKQQPGWPSNTTIKIFIGITTIASFAIL